MSITWNWNPLIAVSLLLPLWAYAHGVMYLWRKRIGHGIARWQVAAFVSGIFVIFIALVSPIDTLGEQLLSVHMIQHLLLIIIAPVLLVIGTPPTIFLWVFPTKMRRTIGRWGRPKTPLNKLWHFLTTPLVAWMLHAATLWLWHLPGPYQAAVANATIHWLEHMSFFGTGLLFWYAALNHTRSHYFGGALMIFTTAMHSSVLGALMTFANSIWYPIYKERTLLWGISPLEDQQLAGVIMWVPAGIAYLIVIIFLLGIGLRKMSQAEQGTQNY